MDVKIALPTNTIHIHLHLNVLPCQCVLEFSHWVTTFVFTVIGLLLTIRLCKKWEYLQKPASASSPSAPATDSWSIANSGTSGRLDSGVTEDRVADAEAKSTGRRWVACEFCSKEWRNELKLTRVLYFEDPTWWWWRLEEIGKNAIDDGMLKENGIIDERHYGLQYCKDKQLLSHLAPLPIENPAI